MSFRVLMLVASFAPAITFGDTLVKLETATPVEICPKCSEVVVPLLADAKSVIKVAEDPVIDLVFFGTSPLDGGKFAAKWYGSPFPRAIHITLDSGRTMRTGMYDLYLNLQPKSVSDAALLKIQLVRPAAKLDAIPKLIVNRTLGCMWPCPDSHPPIRLAESGGKSEVSISRFDAATNASIGVEPVGGTLASNTTLPVIDPGKQSELDYKLAGAFGVGAATGTMRIDAPQLAAPLTFDYEVRTRVHWIYIGITILIGLLISYFVKVRLQQTIEYDQAHLDAAKLVERVTQEATRHADPAFTAAYRDRLTVLNAAMTGASAADINTAKVALDTAWNAALQSLAKRHQDQLDALDKLRDITGYDWLVPPEIANAVLLARTSQAQVVALIERDNLTQAEVCRRQIVLDLANNIFGAALTWQAGAQQILNSLTSATTGISPDIRASLVKPAAGLSTALNKVAVGTALATPEQIQQTLSDIKFERTSFQQFLEWLSSALQMEAAAAAAQIPVPVPANWNMAIFTKAPHAVTDFSTWLKTLADHPDRTAMPAQLAKLAQAWADALQQQFPAPNSQVQAQLDLGNYLQATKLALQQRTTAGAAAAAPAAAVGRLFMVPEFYRDHFGAAALPQQIMRTRFQTIATSNPAIPTPVTDAAKLAKDKMTQSVLLGVLLIVAGYGLQLATFVGTFTEFSTLFFWAFALDLTVDQIGRVAKKT